MDDTPSAQQLTINQYVIVSLDILETHILDAIRSNATKMKIAQMTKYVRITCVKYLVLRTIRVDQMLCALQKITNK